MIEYDVYYDESKEDGYWHGILFVPIETNAKLTSLLGEARNDYPFKHRLHFVCLGANEPTDSLRTKLTESYINIGCSALQQQKFEKFQSKAKVGKFPKVIDPIRAKFVAYRAILNTEEMYGINRGALISRTLKSALKGAIHYLFDETNDIGINRIFFEGEDPAGVADAEIMYQLKNQKRDYIKKLPENFIFQTSDHNKLDEARHINDSYILQLCDLLIGATRFSVISNVKESSSRYKASLPVRKILEYSNKPYARMKESRFYRGFSLAQAEKRGGEWVFNNLQSIQRENMSNQVKLI
jgi:hypothetical protein